jgi:hypothetical protein
LARTRSNAGMSPRAAEHRAALTAQWNRST